MTTTTAPTSTSPGAPGRSDRRPRRARRPRFDRHRARDRSPARPRRLRRCRRAAHRRKCADRPRRGIRAPGTRIDAATSQPQRWALMPALARCRRTRRSRPRAWSAAPRSLRLDLAGTPRELVAFSFRGARRSLDNWSRRALLYPALVVLSLIAMGGAAGTVAAATSSNPAPASGRTYRANGHRLYLNCVGSGAPTVVLFNGLGEWTPNWAWVQANVSATAARLRIRPRGRRLERR